MMATLTPEHLTTLRDGSGISDAIIEARGYQSVSGGDGVRLLRDNGFSATQARLQPGLLLPLHTTDGQQALMIYGPIAHALIRNASAPGNTKYQNLLTLP
jgi:hypothetical protein